MFKTLRNLWNPSKPLQAKLLLENTATIDSLADNVYVDSDDAIRRWGASGELSAAVFSSKGLDVKNGISTFIPRSEAQAQAYLLAKHVSFARNMVTQTVNHIVGADFAVIYSDKDKQKLFDSYWKTHKLRKILFSIVRRVETYGECFIIKMSNGALRFVPLNVVATPAKYSGDNRVIDGIFLNDPKDPCSIGGYFINDEFFSVARVRHFKAYWNEEDTLRGWPILYDGAKYMLAYEKFLESRQKLNWFRSAILLLRKHIGKTGGDIRNFVSKASNGVLNRPNENTPINWKRQANGAILDTSDKVEYEFLAPNTGANEAEIDARMLRLAACTYFSLPEYLGTMDASNANYASTLVAESPGVKAFTAKQLLYCDDFNYFFSWIDHRLVDCQITWPNLVVRDTLAEAQKFEIEKRNGVLDNETWCQLVNRDYEIVRERIESTGSYGE